MNRVALYARVSSERQEQDATIDSQVASLKDLAKKQEDLIVEVYRDDGYSGELLARPALDRLRDDAARHLFDRILILAPDRLARKWSYADIVADELRKHGVTIQYANQKNDGTAEGNLLLGVMGQFGEYEKAKILERSRRGKLHKARMGFIVTGQAPYGYQYIPKVAGKPGHFVIDPERAEIVRLIFQLYTQGFSISLLMAELARRGIPPIGRFGKRPHWSRSILKRILHRETYTGVWHYQKYYSAEPQKKTPGYTRMLRTSRRLRPRSEWIPIPGIPPIIDRDLFKLAQETSIKNTIFSMRNTRHEYLLRGLGKCGECGKSYQGIPVHGEFYYRCNNRRLLFPAPRTCQQGAVRASQIETAVWSALKGAINDPALILGAIPAIQTYKAARPDIAAQKAEIERKNESISASENRLLDALSQGFVTAIQVKAHLDKLQAQKAELLVRERDLDSQADTYNPTPSVHEYCQKIARGLDILDKDFARRQEFVRMIVDEVVIHPGKYIVRGAIPLSSGVIAATSSRSYGHKTSFKFELLVAA